MNELYCSGCRVYLKTKHGNLFDAVDELLLLCEKVGIEICAEGYMRLSDSAGNIIEES